MAGQLRDGRSRNFGDGLFEAFEARYGYDAHRLTCPCYERRGGRRAVTRSDRFLWDCAADGGRPGGRTTTWAACGNVGSRATDCTTWLENYGHWGFPGEFLQYGGQSDEVAGEYWSEGELGDIENRAASSCGHIYGKRKVSAESYHGRSRSALRAPSAAG